MKKLFLLIILLPGTVLAAEENSSFTVGVTIPLTGDFASYGELVTKGVELAKEDLIKRNIILDVKYEDACLPANAVSALIKLVKANKIQGLAANFCVIAMPAMSSIIQDNKIPSFHSAIASDSILNLGGYIFTTDLKVKTEARLLAEYAYDILNARKAGILSIETDFGIDYRTYFAKRFEELGGQIILSESQPIGVSDFRSELIKLKARKPDVVLAAHLGLTLGLLLKQAGQIKFKTQFLGTNEAEDLSVRSVAKENADGLICYVPEPREDNSKSKMFEKSYLAKYNSKPGMTEASSYDSTTLLAESLYYCKGEPECTRDRILGIKEYEGASGLFTLSGSEESLRNFTLKQIKSGAIEGIR